MSADFWNGDTSLWLDQCDMGRAGPRPTLHNALLALRLDPSFTGKFRYDQMQHTAIFDNHPLEDIHTFRIHEWMQANGLNTIGLEPVREAIDIVAREHPFHPLRDWLHSLAWDGNLRLANWLHTYLGADDTEYHRVIGQMFLVAMVARIFQPGCKADYMLVLEGPQGSGKSSACRSLAGEQYFSDALPDLSATGDAVRLAMHLRGKWLIEVSELSAFSKAEAAHLKAFLTSQVEKFTPKHARLEVTEPRQCVFIGTTNDDAYLKDETGGRRFWPAKCSTIDLNALERDRDQLFAEAVQAYLNTAQWWPDRDFERQFIAPVQESRRFVDAWEEPVAAYLAVRAQVTLLEVATEAIGIPKERFNRLEQNRLSAILRTLGWEKKRSTGGAHVWVPAPRQ